MKISVEDYYARQGETRTTGQENAIKARTESMKKKDGNQTKPTVTPTSQRKEKNTKKPPALSLSPGIKKSIMKYKSRKNTGRVSYSDVDDLTAFLQKYHQEVTSQDTERWMDKHKWIMAPNGKPRGRVPVISSDESESEAVSEVGSSRTLVRVLSAASKKYYPSRQSLTTSQTSQQNDEADTASHRFEAAAGASHTNAMGPGPEVEPLERHKQNCTAAVAAPNAHVVESSQQGAEMTDARSADFQMLHENSVVSSSVAPYQSPMGQSHPPETLSDADIIALKNLLNMSVLFMSSNPNQASTQRELTTGNENADQDSSQNENELQYAKTVLRTIERLHELKVSLKGKPGLDRIWRRLLEPAHQAMMAKYSRLVNKNIRTSFDEFLAHRVKTEPIVVVEIPDC